MNSVRVRPILFFYFSLALLVFWWIKIYFTGEQTSPENYLYGVAYAVVALLGGLNGLRISLRWGGLKSYLGLGIFFLSLGLLGEAFGQLTWAYYNLVKQVEVPYPSIADIGYFSIVPFYFISMLYFFKVCGGRISLKAYKGRIIAVVVPILMIVVSYYMFVRGQTLDFSQPIKTLLDLGYPLGEAIYVSLSIITISVTAKVLGGEMRNKLLVVLLYFIMQFVTDFSFLYTSGAGTYYNGSFVDLFYALSLCVGSIGVSMFERDKSLKVTV